MLGLASSFARLATIFDELGPGKPGEFAGAYAKAWNEELARIRGTAAGPLQWYPTKQADQWPLSIEI